jgi:serine/threonine-protein kinase
MVGSSIGRYKIVQSLGAGGMGEVFLARDPDLGRNVALKRLKGFETEGPEARALTLREARRAAQLNHPGIATIYDVLESEGRAYIVMEFVEGESLAARLRSKKPAIDETLSVARQICDAMVVAHAHGIIHRDLKPANIVLTPAGKVKILDFGLARRQLPVTDTAVGNLDTTLTETISEEGKLVGTPAYMSPEQLRGAHGDPRSDVYSFGVVVYEMLAGRRPFEAAGLMELAAAVLTTTPTPLGAIDASIPGRLNEIVSTAMARNPQDRQQSMTQLASELETLTASLATTGSGAIVPDDLSRRRRGLLILAAAAAAVIAVGYAVWGPDWQGPARGDTVGGPPVVVVLPLKNESGDPASEALCAGFEDVLVSNLASIPGVTVVSRSATVEAGSHTSDPSEIGAKLGATLLVEGGFQRTEDLMRVTAHLVDRSSKMIVWSGTYDAKPKEFFGLQRELATGLAGALKLALTPVQRQRLDTAPTSNVEAFAEYAQGRSFLDRQDVSGNVDRAIALFESARTKDPKFALAHAGLGEALWQKYRQTKDASLPEKAREATLEALRVDPEQSRVRYALAVIYRGTGHDAEAIEELHQALAIQPNIDDAHRVLGELLSKAGRIDDAVLEFKQAIRLRPNFDGHHRALAIALYRAGRYPEATAAIRRAIELQPDSRWDHQVLGSILHSQGDTKGAIASYETANRIEPTAEAFSNIGTIRYAEQRFPEAARAYREAVKLSPKNAALQRNLGDALQRLGEADESRSAYLAAAGLCEDELRVNPKSGRSLALLALLQAKLGRPAEAESRSAEAIAVAPTDSIVLYQAGVVQALLGHPDRALDVLGKAVERGYSVNDLRQDDDLSSLHPLPSYRKLAETGR